MYHSVPDSFERLIDTISELYIYVCPGRWMNACMFVYEYDSYQDMCSFYDILFNVLPLTMANNLFS